MNILTLVVGYSTKHSGLVAAVSTRSSFYCRSNQHCYRLLTEYDSQSFTDVRAWRVHRHACSSLKGNYANEISINSSVKTCRRSLGGWPRDRPPACSVSEGILNFAGTVGSALARRVCPGGRTPAETRFDVKMHVITMPWHRKTAKSGCDSLSVCSAEKCSRPTASFNSYGQRSHIWVYMRLSPPASCDQSNQWAAALTLALPPAVPSYQNPPRYDTAMPPTSRSRVAKRYPLCCENPS